MDSRKLSLFVRMSALALLLGSILPVGAQFSSNVQGTVVDSSGAVIANAAIMLHNVSTGVDLQETANATGFYRFSAVAPGDYQVKAAISGFKPVSIAVTVTTGETRGVDILLSLASSNTNVTVDSVASEINPDETRVVSTLGRAGNQPTATAQSRCSAAVGIDARCSWLSE